MNREIVTIITAITGERVIIGKAEMQHAINDHYPNITRGYVFGTFRTCP